MIFEVILSGVLLFVSYLFLGWMISLIYKTSAQTKENKERLQLDNYKQVNSSVYDTDYYLHAYSGNLKDYLSNLKNLPISLRRCFELAYPKSGEKVLDLGCGRGHLAYQCVMKGCIVTAIDYSKDAIDLTLKTKETLPELLKDKMTVKRIDFKELDNQKKYDIIFMADLLEHLYDWELKILFDKVRQILRPHTGRLIIHTAPNKIWINIIFPLKRILDWPKTLRKKKDFYYKRDKYKYDPEMHINEQTPRNVKKLLKSRGFKAKVWCDDGSSNVISILTKRLAGADIWAIAKIVQ